MSMFLRQRSMRMFVVFCILFGFFQIILLSLQRDRKPLGELGDGGPKLPAEAQLGMIEKRHVGGGGGDALASNHVKQFPPLGKSLQFGELPQLGESPQLGQSPELGHVPRLGQSPQLRQLPHLVGQSPLEQRGNQSSDHAVPQDVPDSYNTFISPYHRHWKADCPAIFSGDKKALRTTYEMLQKERLKTNGSVAVPSDGEVRTWTRDCYSYKRLRRFPTNPGTEEEAGFQVAYIIVAHKEAAQVERLLRAIYQPQNLYCIHPDAKSSREFHEAIRSMTGCFENVFIASKLEDVQYAGYTKLLADVNCMRDLSRKRGSIYRWRYVMNLCGQDFPLKTNLEIVRQLKAYKRHNDITGILPPPYIKGRTKHHHITKYRHVMMTTRLKEPPPHNFTVHFGNAYYAATWAFVDYMLTSPQGVDLLEWSNDTFSPDEHFWATLQRGAGTPGGYPHATWDENVRFMKWGDIKKHPACRGKYVRAVCVFGVGYLDYLATQPYLFANKFHYSFDPVAIQCIEEALNNRTRNPLESEKLSNFPVTNLVWQNHTALVP
ncbi:N-acetyllactosaminide beta-1,6-N-acetylglucosaminyl-transferase-like [Asterias amurensis]|uniref:N-acetyllactosaminide beta-1,6-N-acetylglucosaminyl-transferase-like n=1 Tax=Asterias amurensis TaxID=7602 RepID=UPI003AB80ACF